MASPKSTEILEEMIQLSVDVINLCKSVTLPRSVIGQTTRSVTSIGSNFSEAQDASSKRDFVNKIYIAKKEASETKYWLAIIERLGGDTRLSGTLSERVQSFVMMLQKIINTSKKGKSQIAIR